MSERQLLFAATLRQRYAVWGIALAAMTAALNWNPANAETLGGALAKAYLSNPDINQQRAAVRASDENIPKANAGYLPTINAQASDSFSYTKFGSAVENIDIFGEPVPVGGGSGSEISHPRGYGVTINQNIWNGNRTVNGVRQAASS